MCGSLISKLKTCQITPTAEQPTHDEVFVRIAFAVVQDAVEKAKDILRCQLKCDENDLNLTSHASQSDIHRLHQAPTVVLSGSDTATGTEQPAESALNTCKELLECKINITEYGILEQFSTRTSLAMVSCLFLYMFQLLFVDVFVLRHNFDIINIQKLVHCPWFLYAVYNALLFHFKYKLKPASCYLKSKCMNTNTQCCQQDNLKLTNTL